ncbi:Nose resistant to fluoxetine protein 6-like protein [Dinothrombium tinctorium]|uniref:Nose resistant to fluoxetine protein 6-like protein n=1 Tax=Dinothrombium tinctorium TaxID=1965070 RepID=A0A443RID0_9ACAR|nr:Nose resistant to fluoxetine protein 6-like protein [Dinothrombium tinctorium]
MKRLISFEFVTITFIVFFIHLLHSSFALIANDTSENEDGDDSVIASEKILNEFNNGNKSNANSIWIAYGNGIQILFSELLKQLLPLALDFVYESNISASCSSSLLKTFVAIKEQKSWAIRMIDASGRFVPGILDGTITSLGSFDECLQIKSADSEVSFVGKYCLITGQLPLPPKPSKYGFETRLLNLSESRSELIMDVGRYAQIFYDMVIRVGICVPSACSTHDVQIILNSLSKRTLAEIKVKHCETSKAATLNDVQLFLGCCFVVVIILVTISTFYELFFQSNSQSDKYKSRSKFISAFLAFSLISNGKEFFADRSTTNINAIDGIRVLSMIWMFVIHVYFFFIEETFAFSRNFFHATEDVLFQLIINGFVINDTFFVIGAAMVTRSILRSVKMNKRLNIIEILMKYLFQMLVPLSFTIAALIVFGPFIRGPLSFEYLDIEIDKCMRNYIYNLFFVSNWFKLSDTCYPSSFYLSVQMQLFIFTLSAIIPFLVKWPPIGICIISFTICSNTIAIIVATYLLRYPAAAVYDSPSRKQFYEKIEKSHLPTYLHLSPYLIGVVLGYIFFKRKKIRMPRKLNFFIWFIAIITLFTVPLSTYSLTIGYEWPLFISATYAGLHRVIWSLSIMWICYSCASGTGGEFFFISLQS